MKEAFGMGWYGLKQVLAPNGLSTKYQELMELSRAELWRAGNGALPPATMSQILRINLKVTGHL